MLTEARHARFVSVVQSLVNPLILITGVDPDAIGSALGLAEILLLLQPALKIRIAYCGSVAHPQNRAIFNQFNLHDRIESVAKIKTLEGNDVILVDSSSVDESRIPEWLRPLKPKIVIDHHRGGLKEEREGQFVWIEDIGAASTLIVELYRALNLQVGRAVHETDLLLALGIHTDTHALVGASPRDLDAYGEMMRTVPPANFKALMKYPLTQKYFDHLSHVLGTRTVQGSHLVASMGVIDPEDGDDLATIADMLIRMTGITLVVISAIIGDSVRLSARCTDPTVSLDGLLKKWFGEKNGGAKLTSDGMGVGGAFISSSLGFWFSSDVGPVEEQVVLKKIVSLVHGESH